MEHFILTVEHLTKHFGGVAATVGIHFQLRQGELLGIIGPNGSGKTTLVNLRGGVRDPDGRWELLGYVTNLTDKEYLLDAGNTGGAFGIPTFIRGLPRLFGVEAVFRF